MGQLTTQAMSRLVAAGNKSNVDDAVAALADLKAVHIVDYTGDDDGFSMGRPNDVSEEIGRDLNRYRSVSSQLTVDEPKIPLEAGPIRGKMAADLPTLVEEMLASSERIDVIESEVNSIDDESEVLTTIQPLGIDLDLFAGYESVTVLVGTMKDASGVKQAAGDGISIVADGKPAVAAVFCENDAASEVQSSLDALGFSAITPPEGEGSVANRLAELATQKAELLAEQAELQAELDRWSEANGTSLMGGIELLERDMSLALGPVRVAVSEHTFVLDGWIETDRTNEVRAALSETCLHIDIEPFKVAVGGGHHGHLGIADQPPIKFAERQVSKPMELITDLMGRPAYGKVDPTLFMFITYPIFFGLMLGDMAYGFFTMGAGYLLYTKIGHKETGLLAAKFLWIIGIATVIFGYIYGEFAGFEFLPHYACGDVTSHGMAEATATGCHWAEGHSPVWVSWMTALYPNGGAIHWTTDSLTLFAFAGVEHGLPFGLELAFPFHRVSLGIDGGNLEDLILLTIYMGVFQVLLGLVIGFRDTLIYGDSHGNRGWSVAILDKGSWICILLGGFLFAYAFLGVKVDYEIGEMMKSFLFLDDLGGATGYTGFLLLLGRIGTVVMLAGVAMLIAASYLYHGMGLAIAMMLGPIEGIGMMSTVVSYVRLFAVGVVGVKIAWTGNEMIYPVMIDSFSAGGLGLIIGIALLIFWLVVQMFAWILGLVSPNIHAARLHLVEWMKQFYEVAGEKFSPFGFTAQSVEVE